MEGLNIWGICTFVMPLVLIIVIGLMFIIASILDRVGKLIKRIKNVEEWIISWTKKLL